MQHDFTVWYGTTTEKILAWRQLREQAVDKTVDQIVDMVDDWWTYTPWVRKTLDPYKPETWPTPWDMISKGEFCRSAIALGQAYTLWTCAPQLKTELWLINNFSEKDIHLVAVIDKKIMLNYVLGHVMKVDECDFEVLNIVQREDLGHIKI